MIEILQFGLSANRGGIETYLRKIWNNIDHTQFHFSFIDMTGEGQRPCFYEELKASGCDFYKITPRNVSILQNRRDIQRLFREKHFDIFHFNVNTLSYLLPVEEALKNGCKVLVHSRSSGAINSSRLTKALHERNKRKLRKLDVTRIAVSQMAGDWLFGGKAFVVYHNGVETERFAFKEENRKAVRTSLGCEGKKVIANVGAFMPAKNHRFMVEAFEALTAREPDAVLWFVGDGSLRPEMEALVKAKGLQDKILFLGSRRDLPELYAGMDLFWFPSLYEGYGNVLLEAQCEGVPCLLSDCIPQDARIADNTFAFSLEKSLDEWAQMLQIALQAQKKDRTICWQEMEDKGVSVKAEIQRLEALYRSMLTKKED